jgi:hypothetical protein
MIARDEPGEILECPHRGTLPGRHHQATFDRSMADPQVKPSGSAMITLISFSTHKK